MCNINHYYRSVKMVESTNESQQELDLAPQGAEDNSVEATITLPANHWYHRKYAFNAAGEPTYNNTVVKEIMDIFDQKLNSPMLFANDANGVEEQLFDKDISLVCDAQSVLMNVDPASTGFAFLNLCNKTWAEFASVAYEVVEALSAAKEEPEQWLLDREQDMYALGYKARVLKQALEVLGKDFGFKHDGISRDRVEQNVMTRCERLAKYSFDKIKATGAITKEKGNVRIQESFDRA